MYYVSYVELFEGQMLVVGEEYVNVNDLLLLLESLQYELGMKMVGQGWFVSFVLFCIECGVIMVIEDNYLIQDGILLYQGFEFSGVLMVIENLLFYGDVMFLSVEYDKISMVNQGNDVGGVFEQ